jgi:hypothetical protein
MNKSCYLGELTTRKRQLFMLLGCLLTSSLILLGFQNELMATPLIALTISSLLIALCMRSVFKARQNDNAMGSYALIATIQIPLLVAAILVNLKRGPWMGVVIGTSIFFVIFAPRIVAVVISLAVLAAVSITPVSERIAASYQHFTITGGRSTIWRIGSELVSQFPLGIGFHNSDILRRFAPEIPPELKHFHNNLLNITAESGWLSVMLFAWFIAAVLKCAFSRPFNPMHVAIGCAIIAWQSAGLVEYNAGDSEVLLIAWLLIGVLLHDQRKLCETTVQNPQSRALLSTPN